MDKKKIEIKCVSFSSSSVERARCADRVTQTQQGTGFIIYLPVTKKINNAGLHDDEDGWTMQHLSIVTGVIPSNHSGSNVVGMLLIQ